MAHVYRKLGYSRIEYIELLFDFADKQINQSNVNNFNQICNLLYLNKSIEISSTIFISLNEVYFEAIIIPFYNKFEY